PKLFFTLLLGLAASASVALASASVPRTESTRAVTESPYAQLRVEELSIEGRLARTLVTERIFSGGFYLDTGEAAFLYSREIVDAISTLPTPPENILVIGAGPYTIPQELIRRYPEVKMTVVDIDPALLSLGKEWFGVDEARIVNVVDDGRRFFRNRSEQFDVIVLDAYAALYSIPAHLTTREFFALVEEDVAPDGFVIMNTIAALPEAAGLLGSVVKTFSETFPEAVVLPVGEKGAHELRNFLIASRAPTDAWQPAGNFTGAGFVLTDDYAPLDTLLTPLLRLAAQQ
ncbi:MAG: fused MFS/spermidine synthase, partial [Candidatus Terrybacteria bacterium]|nr:fused MFS/spermidine synthase [Candidatus Terrybacteria bacterium]